MSDKNLPNYEKPLSNYKKPLSSYEKPLSNYEKPLSNYEKPLSNYEKARQMKKTFCFNFFAYHCLSKNVSTSDLRCPQLPLLKKGYLGNISQPWPVHFSASVYSLGLKNVASASKNFSSISFFLPW